MAPVACWRWKILTNTPAVAKRYSRGKNIHVARHYSDRQKQGMRLMDDTLIDLYDRGMISAEEAYARADQKQAMRRYLKI